MADQTIDIHTHQPLLDAVELLTSQFLLLSLQQSRSWRRNSGNAKLARAPPQPEGGLPVNSPVHKLTCVTPGQVHKPVAPGLLGPLGFSKEQASLPRASKLYSPTASPSFCHILRTHFTPKRGRKGGPALAGPAVPPAGTRGSSGARPARQAAGELEFSGCLSRGNAASTTVDALHPWDIPVSKIWVHVSEPRNTVFCTKPDSIFAVSMFRY